MSLPARKPEGSVATRPPGDALISLQIMSDLHLETPHALPMYADFEFEAKSPHLALLGDIGLVHDPRLFSFLETQLRRFPLVLFVMGNHEPYEPPRAHYGFAHYGDDDGGAGHEEGGEQCTYEAAVAKLEAFELASAADAARESDSLSSAPPRRGRFVFLNRRRVDLSDRVTVLGCTLFSHIPDAHASTVSLFVSDFARIAGWTVDQHNAAHAADLRWLNDQVGALASEHRDVVVLTHYCPTTRLAAAHDPEHLADARGVLCAFATDLAGEACWRSAAVRVWAFGHTHFNCDFVDGETGRRVLANQRGYGREDAFDFASDKVVLI